MVTTTSRCNWAAARCALGGLLLGVALVALAGCGGEQPSAPAAPAMTVETGGMALSGTAEGAAESAAADTATAPSAASGVASGGAAGTAEGTEATPEPGAGAAGEGALAAPAPSAGDPAANGPVLEVGAAITASPQAAIYADPSVSALRFGVYDAGTTFTVIEAGGDYTEYPVEGDGRRWYRVRAPDGLAGWLAEP